MYWLLLQLVLVNRKSGILPHNGMEEQKLTIDRLCFQVPAVTLEFGITLVVSPLKGELANRMRANRAHILALMHDQVNALVAKNIRAMMACNDTSTEDQKEVS